MTKRKPSNLVTGYRIKMLANIFSCQGMESYQGNHSEIISGCWSYGLLVNKCVYIMQYKPSKTIIMIPNIINYKENYIYKPFQ